MQPSVSRGSYRIVIPFIMVGVLALIAVGGWLVIKHHDASGGTVTSLNKTYCSSTGKVCFSYPQRWRLVATPQRQVTVTNPTTKTAVLYSPTDIVATVACGTGSCLFNTLSAAISNGFSNANDVAGVYWNKGSKVYVPEYCLLSTTQLLTYDLKVGSTTDLKQPFNAPFTNAAVPDLSQELGIASSPSFSSSAGAQRWLHGADAQMAEAIVNSARLDH